MVEKDKVEDSRVDQWHIFCVRPHFLLIGCRFSTNDFGEFFTIFLIRVIVLLERLGVKTLRAVLLELRCVHCTDNLQI